jgi:hypothetical protein
MDNILRGNFLPQDPPQVTKVTEDLTSRFEAEALKRLGGSISFVSKKKFIFGLDEQKKEGGDDSRKS